MRLDVSSTSTGVDRLVLVGDLEGGGYMRRRESDATITTEHERRPAPYVVTSRFAAMNLRVIGVGWEVIECLDRGRGFKERLALLLVNPLRWWPRPARDESARHDLHLFSVIAPRRGYIDHKITLAEALSAWTRRL